MKTIVHYNKKEQQYQFSYYCTFSTKELTLKDSGWDYDKKIVVNRLSKNSFGRPVTAEEKAKMEIDYDAICRESVSSSIAKIEKRQKFVFEHCTQDYFLDGNNLYINTDCNDIDWKDISALLASLDTENIIYIGIMINEYYQNRKFAVSEMGVNMWKVWQSSWEHIHDREIFEKIKTEYIQSFEVITDCFSSAYAGNNQWNQWEGDNSVRIFDRHGNQYRLPKTSHNYDLENLIGQNFNEFVRIQKKEQETA